jgi:hypothetical protein
MIHLQKESFENDLYNLNYIKNTQTLIFKFECFEIVVKSNFISELCSTQFQEFRDILFAIFGSVDQKI